MNTKKVFLLTLAVICVVSAFLPGMALADGGTYAVTFVNPDGTEAAAPVSVAEGTAVTRPADPVMERRQFTGWFSDPGCIVPYDFGAAVMGDTVIYAGWLDIFTVSASSSNAAWGTVSGGTDCVFGSSVTLTAAPLAGCRFVSWAETGVTNAVYSFGVTANAALTAVFEPIGSPSLSVAAAGCDSVALSWTSVPGATSYDVYRSDSEGGSYGYIGSAAGSAYVDAGLGYKTTYWYKVRACVTGETAVTYGADSAPAGAATAVVSPVISAVSSNHKSVALSWTPVPGATGYQLYRATKPNGKFKLLKAFKSGGILSYINKSLKTNTTYYYKIRSLRKQGRKTDYSPYSQVIAVAPSLAAPTLSASLLNSTGVQLSWNALPGIGGYEVYHSTQVDGAYSKVYTASAKVTGYADMGLAVNTAYYFKVRGYIKSGSKKLYGPFSNVQSAVTAAVPGERIYSLYYQGDSAWGFTSRVRKTACLMTAYADVINNMGKGATPRTVFDSNGGRTIMNFKNLSANFGVAPVSALDFSSPYYGGFSCGQTFVNGPESNGIAAIKEALDRNPEGVICYFTKGSRQHAIVASRYEGDTIFYSDPGRNLGRLVGLADTWVGCHHRMTYKNLKYIVALD